MVLDLLAQYADPILMVGGFVFAATLLPTARDPDAAVPSTTSVPTALTLYLFALTYIAISLPLAAAASGLTAIMWTFVAWKRRPAGDRLLRLRG
ncbi:MAG: hypothetical protein ABEK12_00540 [Candidatus Nanohaloarchaea archaeon]